MIVPKDTPSPRVALVCESCGADFVVPRTRIQHGNVRFCSRDCWREGLLRSFWSKVIKPNDHDGCWLWIGTMASNGYGITKFRGHRIGAHRLAWQLTHGPIPDGLFVLHRCDVRNCVNPAHHFLGTHQDNMTDMVSKGRQVPKERTSPYTHPDTIRRGEQNARAKLTAAQVMEMRERFARGNATMKALARLYGIDPKQVANIVHRRQWKHM